jgi:hypothetical protein
MYTVKEFAFVYFSSYCETDFKVHHNACNLRAEDKLKKVCVHVHVQQFHLTVTTVLIQTTAEDQPMTAVKVDRPDMNKEMLITSFSYGSPLLQPTCVLWFHTHHHWPGSASCTGVLQGTPGI